MNIDKKVNQLKKKLTALYKKYRGHFFAWQNQKTRYVKRRYKKLIKEVHKRKEKAQKLVSENLTKTKKFLRIKLQWLKDEVSNYLHEIVASSDPEDTLARKVHARKIADVIQKRHDDGNVTFAISGRWGSGKTRVLELLEPLLTEQEFKVVWFNIWQYSQEPISLKRAFLKALAVGLGRRVDLSDLDHDSTRIRISWRKLFTLLLALAVLLLTISVFLLIKDNPGVNVDMSVYFSSYLHHLLDLLEKIPENNYVKLLIMPVVLFVFTDILTIKQTTSKITTSDEFNLKFKEIVEKDERIVVFIDDLDRCTPDIVKQILDALVTFFDNDHCSFVVTGDHTVIEKYVGSKLHISPFYNKEGKKDERITEQQEIVEGRRFLKKLFDIYWQIPAPEPARFRQFILDEIKKVKLQNLDEKKEEQLASLLAKFLETNPRAVIRFLTGLSFNLETVAYTMEERQREKGNTDVSKEQLNIELQGLKEVMEQPVLLAKILLIQELFYSLYEELVIQPNVLPLHEKEVRKAGKVSSKLGGKQVTDLLLRQEEIGEYIELLKTQPKFTDENDFVIYNADYFFYLSGFTGLPSQKGPDEDWFLQTLKTATDAKSLIDSLSGASETKQKQLLTLSQKALAGSADTIEKQNIARNMVEVMLDIDSWSDGFEGLVTKLVEANFIHGLQPPIRAKLSSYIFQFAFEKDVNVASFFTTAPWNDAVYLPVKWEAASKAKKLVANVVTHLAPVNDDEFATNESDAFRHLKELAVKSNQEEQGVQDELKPLFDKIIASTFVKPANEERLQAIQLLAESDKKGLSKDVFIQKQTELMQGGNYQNEIQFLLNNHEGLLKYLNDSDLKALRHIGIDFLKDRSSADWSPLADTLLAYPSWEESEKSLISDALFYHLQDTDNGISDYALKYLKRIELKNFIKSDTLLDKFFQTLTVVEEKTRGTILEHLDKNNWLDISQLTEANRNILISLAKGRSIIAKKARKVMKSWGIDPQRTKKSKKTQKRGRKSQ